MAAKIFRDPLYNYISIERETDGWLLDLLECAEVQRLRRIHQLGLSHFTYPAADHSRFSHSLGVVHLMQEALGHLATTCPETHVDEARQPLLAAALVHDIGHGPFSHLFEACLGIQHEDWTCRILRAPESEVHQALRRVDRTLPDRVAALIDGSTGAHPRWQRQLLNSQLDVDRLDYLRRDSLFTGAGYGHFDWYRLLHTFTLHGPSEARRELVWMDKAALAIEEYIFARYYMYQNVYLHKTTRGYERLLQTMWTYAHRLGAARQSSLAEFAGAENPSVRQFLAMEEFVVLAAVQTWMDHSDRALADLARRFMNRKGFAAIDAPRRDRDQWDRALRQVAADNGFSPADVYVIRDEADDLAEVAYIPTASSENGLSRHAIYLIGDGATEPVEISKKLLRLQAVTALAPRPLRYYVPKELLGKVNQLWRGWPNAG
jgi:hypothetical protein